MRNKAKKIRKKASRDIMSSRQEKLAAAILARKEEPPSSLLPKILMNIAQRRRARARLRIFGFSLLSAASVPVLILAVGELIRQLGQNGTLSILSLIFSDSRILLANWRTFFLSVLESVPVLPVLVTSASILLLLVSIKHVFENLVRINFHLTLKNNINRSF